MTFLTGLSEFGKCGKLLFIIKMSVARSKVYLSLERTFLLLCREDIILHLGQMRFYVSEEFIKFNYDTYNYQKQSSVW